MAEKDHDKEHLYIFVNRRKFEEGDGVQPEMTGEQIAALVGVPPDNAVVRLETHGGPREIPIDEKIEIKEGMHFLVAEKDHDKEHLYIFVNRRKFEEGDGVQPEMTGEQIAALVGVPPDNAVVRLETQGEPHEIPIDEKIEIKEGMHFLVTRKTVEGGHES